MFDTFSMTTTYFGFARRCRWHLTAQWLTETSELNRIIRSWFRSTWNSFLLIDKTGRRLSIMPRYPTLSWWLVTWSELMLISWLTFALCFRTIYVKSAATRFMIDGRKPRCLTWLDRRSRRLSIDPSPVVLRCSSTFRGVAKPRGDHAT